MITIDFIKTFLKSYGYKMPEPLYEPAVRLVWESVRLKPVFIKIKMYMSREMYNMDWPSIVLRFTNDWPASEWPWCWAQSFSFKSLGTLLWSYGYALTYYSILITSNYFLSHVHDYTYAYNIYTIQLTSLLGVPAAHQPVSRPTWGKVNHMLKSKSGGVKVWSSDFHARFLHLYH